MSKIAERYAVARNTSNLKIDSRTRMSPADVLTAAGMTAHQHKSAMLLWDVTFNGKTSAKLALVERMAGDLALYMLKEKLKGNPRTISMEVLAWWLHGTCRSCHGRGYEIIPDTPTLSDELCYECHGTGKIKVPESEPHKWLIDRLGKWTGLAGAEMMRKLSVDLD